MISNLEISERADSGPVMKANEFDLAFSRKVREVVAKHNIKYNRDELVVDDGTADRVFAAGVDLLSGVGLYHNDTQRVVKFGKEELENVAREVREGPRAQVFGTGKEEVAYRYRTSTDKQPVVLAAGTQGGGDNPLREDWFIPFVQSFAQEELVLALGITGGVESANGIVPKTGTPTESYVALWESRSLLEACRRADRPGLHLGVPQTATSAAGVLSLITSGLRGRHNMQMAIHVIPELKIDWSRLYFAYLAEQSNIVPWTSASSTLGALCRGPEDTAVTVVASWLGQFAYGHGLPAFGYICNLYGECSLREVLWAYSAAFRAAERHICVPTGACTNPESRFKRSEMGLYWQAAAAVTFSSSGLGFCAVAGDTGLEARLNGEVYNAVAGMEREKANRLVEAIYARFEVERNQPPGYRLFPETYDLKTIQPRPEHLNGYRRAKEELARLGVPFK